MCRYLHENDFTRPLPTELGNLDVLVWLCVRHLTHRAWTRAPSPGCELSVGEAWGCRWLEENDLTGPMPTELGTMDALTSLCVHRPHPPCLDACSVTGVVG